uniref:Glycosyltransferase 2-like domain-containing protein n=1 Tax=Corethron hystrix TaxID=216773 RepID=A0A7S1FRD0_9STRA|mmetsp:Transcript_22706/g.52048  ORF Transcript_22706/g.52048 Transcript_22706/m.52048 type:complete len:634 (+) Transcript_22706:127-2028(+)
MDSTSLPKSSSAFLQKNPTALVPGLNDIDVIIPAHNATATLQETVSSIISSRFGDAGTSESNSDDDDIEAHPLHHILLSSNSGGVPSSSTSINLTVNICIHDDSSTDSTLDLLRTWSSSWESFVAARSPPGCPGCRVSFRLLFSSNPPGSPSVGPGEARNLASSLSSSPVLAMVDADDVLHPRRLYCQMIELLKAPQHKAVLLGATFQRIPEGATAHYTSWANALNHRRIYLEQFREVTVIQPTWMLWRSRFESLGKYPKGGSSLSRSDEHGGNVSKRCRYTLALEDETETEIKLAEDLRFFHAHLHRHEEDTGDNLTPCHIPEVRIVRARRCRRQTSDICKDGNCAEAPLSSPRSLSGGEVPLLTYRHLPGANQSSSTPRRLLLRLRLRAFEDRILRPSSLPEPYPGFIFPVFSNKDVRQGKADRTNIWKTRGFAIWGAGRDGKEVYRNLSDDLRVLVRAFVDVDPKKIGLQNYVNRDLRCKVPIHHFSWLKRGQKGRDDDGENKNGKIEKNGKKLDEGSEKEEWFGKIRKGGYIVSPSNEELLPSSLLSEPQTLLSSKKRKVDRCDTENPFISSFLSTEEANRGSIGKGPIFPPSDLPVLVCVAMYRTNGALEQNVRSIGRTEGYDLWHFS